MKGRFGLAAWRTASAAVFGCALACSPAADPPGAGPAASPRGEAVESAAPPVRAGTVELVATRDATLLESSSGALANGEGSGLFAGRTHQPEDSLRRTLVAFDVGSLPAGVEVTSATLSLTLVHTRPGEHPVGLHRVLADWGEGASKTDGGRGAPSMPGDATWIHTFFPDRLWSRPGGDFAAAASARATVGAEGAYSWGPTAEMTADVQTWLEDAAANFGWLLLGAEDAPGTAKHFASREHEEPSKRPRLTVSFRRPEGD